MSLVKNIVEKQITENPVVVYSKSMSSHVLDEFARCLQVALWLLFLDRFPLLCCRGRRLISGWCPYCRQAKATLAEFGASYQVYELDQIGTIPRLALHPSHPRQSLLHPRFLNAISFNLNTKY